MAFSAVALGTAIPSVLLEYRFLMLVTSLVGMTVGEFLRQVLRPGSQGTHVA